MGILISWDSSLRKTIVRGWRAADHVRSKYQCSPAGTNYAVAKDNQTFLWGRCHLADVSGNVFQHGIAGGSVFGQGPAQLIPPAIRLGPLQLAELLCMPLLQHVQAPCLKLMS